MSIFYEIVENSRRDRVFGGTPEEVREWLKELVENRDNRIHGLMVTTVSRMYMFDVRTYLERCV